MKKIGVVTPFGAINYGQNLQALATLKILEELDYNGVLISCCKHNEYPWKLSLSEFKIRIINKIKDIYYKRLEKKFEKFTLENLSVHKNEDNDFYDYNAFICGSDQIWNPHFFIENAWDIDKVFLRFAPENKRIAYAPSIAAASIPENMIPVYRNYLNEIPFLSCREAQGARLINEISGRNAVTVLDPTLLLTKEQWVRIAAIPVKQRTKPYIFCYFLGVENYYKPFLKDVYSKLGYEIIIANNSLRNYTLPYKKQPAGPLEFVNYIKNASLFVTNSFHGMAFSVNLNTPFLVLPFRGRDNSRFYSILNPCYLQDTVMDENTHFSKEMLEQNFDTANQYLESERERSVSFLKSALASATGG